MATAIQTIDSSALALTDPAKLMSQPEILALADSQFSTLPWCVAHASKQFYPASLPRLVEAHEAALQPVNHAWLADRLKALWKSSVVNGNFEAGAWLSETGRLLADLPHDILADAIDQAVKASERGFMPTVGQIRAIAEPRLERRRTQAERLRSVYQYVLRPRSVAREPEPAVRKIDDSTAESTADILKRLWPTMAKHERGGGGEGKLNLDPSRPTRKPTRADYIRMGVDQAVLGDEA